MKNKIIAGTIAVLFLPASVAFFGLLNEYFLFRVIFMTVLCFALMFSLYKFVKLILDDRDADKRRKGNRP
jgi:hypothetical protein